MRRGAGGPPAKGHRTSSILVVALCAQALAAFLPTPPDPCACSEATCCRAAKRPAAARASCHDGEAVPAAVLRCHHPERDVPLPTISALLPASTATSSEIRLEALAGHPATRPVAGFSRLDLPPPRAPRRLS